MTMALATRDVDALAVTAEQLDLIRRTIAKDATPDELKLYLFDCHRQGVHPLDKLIHFTKRAGKYTPITSIDFMRIRAAETSEYAGSDAPLFTSDDGVWSSIGAGTKPPTAAMVTVWRLVQGQRCKFEAVARWKEYKPEANDFMWQKMPHTMLGKCAEALALRKGFPRQLAGLYAKEELDQADTVVVAASSVPPQLLEAQREIERRIEATGVVRETPLAPAAVAPVSAAPSNGTKLPDGAKRIAKIGPGRAGAHGEVFFEGESKGYMVWKAPLIDEAERFLATATPVFPKFKKSVSGNERIEALNEARPFQSRP